MIKALITGGAGFIGYHLAEYLLKNNYQVDLVDNLSRGVIDENLSGLLSNSNIRFINRNLCEPGSFKNFDNNYQYIYHLAAIIGVTNVLDRPFEVLRDNLTIHLNILDFAKLQKSLKRFIFTSTSEVYAGTLRHFKLDFPTPETTPLAIPNLSQPRTSYMLSKIYGEALCCHSAVPFSIVRPHNIYGPRMGMAHVIPALLRKAHHCENGDGLEVFSPDHSRTFCYISDAVRMIRRIAETPACLNQTLNVGNQIPEISMRNLAGHISRIVNKDLKIIAKPETPGSPKRRCPNMTNTFELTVYQPNIDLDSGIKSTYGWYKKNIFEQRKACAN